MKSEMAETDPRESWRILFGADMAWSMQRSAALVAGALERADFAEAERYIGSMLDTALRVAAGLQLPGEHGPLPGEVLYDGCGRATKLPAGTVSLVLRNVPDGWLKAAGRWGKVGS